VAIGREPWMRTQFGIALPRRLRSSAATAFAEVLAEVDARFADDPSPQAPAGVEVVHKSTRKARRHSRRA
jgi:hypothetical protein